MDRKKKCEEERHRAWEEAKDVQDRIKRLEKVASKYPDFMSLLSDIAISYLEMADIDSAIKIYQNMIDQKDKFEFLWNDELGKAYLFTQNYQKAIDILAESNCISYDKGLFLAFSYLKNGNKGKCKFHFDEWISENLEKSFEQYYYKKYIKALFNEEESKFIERMWDAYYNKYLNMEPYQLYCELYKQHYMKPDLSGEDFEIPEKLTKIQFEELKAEYLYLDKKAMFGDMEDTEYDRYFELRELLFSDTII